MMKSQVKFDRAIKKRVDVLERKWVCDEGFVYILFKKKDITYSLQACLTEKTAMKDDEKRHKALKRGENIYKKELKKNDSGMSWGICADVNEKAHKEFGEGFCRKLLCKEARNIGIKIT